MKQSLLLVFILLVFSFSFVNAESDIYKNLKLLLGNYEINMVKAINNNDFSLVASYLSKNSPLYNSQKQLVGKLYGKGIKEELLDYEIIDYDDSSEEKIPVYVHEKFNIYYPEKQRNEVREFDYEYIVSAAKSNYGLSGIQVWDRNITDSYLPRLKRGEKVIYNHEEPLKVVYPINGISFMDLLKNRNRWNGLLLENANSNIVYIETENGLYIQGLQSKMYLELKYPVQLNKEWEDVFPSAGADSANENHIIHYKIISVSETITTTFKIFHNVIAVKSDNGIKYFAKGYGLIKEDDWELSAIKEE